MSQELTWNTIQKTITELEESKPRKDGRMKIACGERITDKRVLNRLKKMGIEYEEK